MQRRPPARRRPRSCAQITLTKTSDLQYATIISGATASTVAVSTAGAATCGAGLTCTGTTTAGSYNVQGTNGAVGAGRRRFERHSQRVAWRHDVVDADLFVAEHHAGHHRGQFQVGGTLSVGANQASGDYSGTFNVTANYQ